MSISLALVTETMFIIVISILQNSLLSIIFSWIRKTGQIVDKIVQSKQIETQEGKTIEMDKFFTFFLK